MCRMNAARVMRQAHRMNAAVGTHAHSRKHRHAQTLAQVAGQMQTCRSSMRRQPTKPAARLSAPARHSPMPQSSPSTWLLYLHFTHSPKETEQTQCRAQSHCRPAVWPMRARHHTPLNHLVLQPARCTKHHAAVHSPAAEQPSVYGMVAASWGSTAHGPPTKP